jgi:hypothetical protein
MYRSLAFFTAGLLLGIGAMAPALYAQDYWDQLADGDLRYEAGAVRLGVDEWIGTRRAQSFLPEADNLSVSGTNHAVLGARNNLFYIADSNHNGARAHVFGFRTTDPGDDNWIERMRITEGGHVGIGTHVPDWTLEARGKIAADAGGGDHLLLSPQSGTLRYWDDDWSNYEDRILTWAWTDELGDHMRYFIPGVDNDKAPTFTHFQSKGFLFEGGAVGIGTRSPDVMLSVNGTTRTKEVIVETKNWRDYVFDEGYDLRSPTRLAAFIEREGHLPALPSAAKVNATGQSVGTVQRGLVQTVEELARYAIEQRRRADSLAARMEARHAQQQKQIDALRRQLQQLRDQVNEE